MRGSPSFAAFVLASLLALALALSSAACATRIDVDRAPGADFSQFKTWDWQPGGLKVETPGNRSKLVRDLSLAIERSLADQGFERGGADADFFVVLDVLVRRGEVAVRVPLAPYLFSSNSSGASYWIEGSRVEYRTVHDLTLALGIRAREGPVVWRAIASNRVEEGRALPIHEIVGSLASHLPEASGVPAPGEIDRTPLVERLAVADDMPAR